MDVFSHGLWGAAAFGRHSKKMFWSAVAFGIGPDVFSFGIFTIATMLGIVPRPDWSSGLPPESVIPLYVHHLYDVTHSLIVFATVFFLVWGIRKKPFFPMLAWPLHILMDIPTHSTRFFSTPFLWPLPHPHVDGVSWSHPLIFWPNWIALIIIYSVWGLHVWRTSKLAKIR